MVGHVGLLCVFISFVLLDCANKVLDEKCKVKRTLSRMYRLGTKLQERGHSLAMEKRRNKKSRNIPTTFFFFLLLIERTTF